MALTTYDNYFSIGFGRETSQTRGLQKKVPRSELASGFKGITGAFKYKECKDERLLKKLLGGFIINNYKKLIKKTLYALYGWLR